MIDRRRRRLPGIVPALLMAAILIPGCGQGGPGPVPLYPEDQCASCRMAVSSRAFASEIIHPDGSASKFDDLRCLENYRKAHPDEPVHEIYVANYETGEWMPYRTSVIVRTGIETPMGSGRVAVTDQKAAAGIIERYPPRAGGDEEGECCGGSAE